ncbi:PREDICTED: PRKC apoptosis WT1 regulator protein-like [Nanorana parkeri]|uniref:PRKC apoptosis WT1 regulator protein-like n=1 Tax=Nanorana parkeri TaxID=125878 RepID=UPI000854CEFF|nr:PREDICTED: PRKC apoptosis WT1 regulator protein-like [Nanorana parkeri]
MSKDAKCNSAEQVPFMEEWKARRERMRLRSVSSSFVGSRSIDIQVQQEVDLQSQSWSSNLGQDHEKDMGGVKATTSSIKIQSLVTAEIEAHKPVTSKTKEMKGSPQNKHRTQIEKRKLREKRRPTGVVNMFPSEDPDENEDVKEKEEHKEQEVVIQSQYPNPHLQKANTNSPLQSNYGGRCQNTKETADVSSIKVRYLKELAQTDVHSLGPAPDNVDNNLKERQSWMEELQKTVREKRQDNLKLTSQLNDTEGSVLQLQIEMKTLAQKMKGAEDEKVRLKEENQMLLKMMGQLSS